MFTKLVSELVPGDVLAGSLLSADGMVLLHSGVRLSDSLIAAVRDRGFMAVHVRDGLADDVLAPNIVSMQVRSQITGTVARLTSGINASALAAAGDDDGRVPSVGAAADRMGEDGLVLDVGTTAAFSEVQEQVVALIDLAMATNTIGGLESLKTHSEYTFQHSVDVAITGALLGSRLGLDDAEMQNLVLGCLVHDIGKTFIDLAILDKEGELSVEERREVERHPKMGFEILRRLPVESILPAHVAYQHHERQDGRGYPRGLVGGNRVARTELERLSGRRMLLIAEIAAVADVHSALTSDRPYRNALSASECDAILARLAGPHLNAQVVDMLRRIAPLYPVGTWVEVTAGPSALLGRRGVVVSTDDLRRPCVRLLLDRVGADGVEHLDLRLRPDVQIDALPPHADPREHPPMLALAEAPHT